MKQNNRLTTAQSKELLQILEARFEKHRQRHTGMQWTDVAARIQAHAGKLWSLYEMERTGGEPDVVSFDPATGAYVFFDCAAETPKDRRSICYDEAALQSRKEHKPKNSAVGMAETMGIELLNEEQYRKLQTLGGFDLKTSSWIKTPDEVRILGGALFCDRRYNKVFLYHNGAESYYASRGFRGWLHV
ncbi:MAG TPA: DUF4256 domain-containing protein [Lacibacter sp.]|nr:DUF4256 domain-containing protein [Lacibacter sp.]